MPRYSVNQATTKRWSLEEDAFHYASSQFQGAGLWRYKVSDFGDEKTRELLEDNGLTVSSLSSIGGFTGCEGRWKDAVQDAIETLHTAHAIGATNVLLHTGSRNRHIRSQALRCLTSGINELLPVAADFGIRLLLQPMLESVSRRWNFLHDWGTLFEVIDRYSPATIGFCLNTHHATFLNEIWDQLPSRIEQLGLVQVSDSIRLPMPGDHRNDCLLGEGSLLPDLQLRKVLDAGYHGWVEVESIGANLNQLGYAAVVHGSGQFVAQVAAARGGARTDASLAPKVA